MFDYYRWTSYTPGNPTAPPCLPVGQEEAPAVPETIEFHTNPWVDDPQYPAADWQNEVAADETRLGYLEWVQHKREEHE